MIFNIVVLILLRFLQKKSSKSNQEQHKITAKTIIYIDINCPGFYRRALWKHGC